MRFVYRVVGLAASIAAFFGVVSHEEVSILPARVFSWYLGGSLEMYPKVLGRFERISVNRSWGSGLVWVTGISGRFTEVLVIKLLVFCLFWFTQNLKRVGGAVARVFGQLVRGSQFSRNPYIVCFLRTLACVCYHIVYACGLFVEDLVLFFDTTPPNPPRSALTGAEFTRAAATFRGGLEILGFDTPFSRTARAVGELFLGKPGTLVAYHLESPHAVKQGDGVMPLFEALAVVSNGLRNFRPVLAVYARIWGHYSRLFRRAVAQYFIPTMFRIVAVVFFTVFFPVFVFCVVTLFARLLWVFLNFPLWGGHSFTAITRRYPDRFRSVEHLGFSRMGISPRLSNRRGLYFRGRVVFSFSGRSVVRSVLPARYFFSQQQRKRRFGGSLVCGTLLRHPVFCKGMSRYVMASRALARRYFLQLGTDTYSTRFPVLWGGCVGVRQKAPEVFAKRIKYQMSGAYLRKAFYFRFSVPAHSRFNPTGFYPDYFLHPVCSLDWRETVAMARHRNFLLKSRLPHPPNVTTPFKQIPTLAELLGFDQPAVRKRVGVHSRMLGGSLFISPPKHHLKKRLKAKAELSPLVVPSSGGVYYWAARYLPGLFVSGSLFIYILDCVLGRFIQNTSKVGGPLGVFRQNLLFLFWVLLYGDAAIVVTVRGGAVYLWRDGVDVTRELQEGWLAWCSSWGFVTRSSVPLPYARNFTPATRRLQALLIRVRKSKPVRYLRSRGGALVVHLVGRKTLGRFVKSTTKHSFGLRRGLLLMKTVDPGRFLPKVDYGRRLRKALQQLPKNLRRYCSALTANILKAHPRLVCFAYSASEHLRITARILSYLRSLFIGDIRPVILKAGRYLGGKALVPDTIYNRLPSRTYTDKPLVPLTLRTFKLRYRNSCTVVASRRRKRVLRTYSYMELFIENLLAYSCLCAVRFPAVALRYFFVTFYRSGYWTRNVAADQYFRSVWLTAIIRLLLGVCLMLYDLIRDYTRGLRWYYRSKYDYVRRGTLASRDGFEPTPNYSWERVIEAHLVLARFRDGDHVPRRSIGYYPQFTWRRRGWFLMRYLHYLQIFLFKRMHPVFFTYVATYVDRHWLKANAYATMYNYDLEVPLYRLVHRFHPNTRANYHNFWDNPRHWVFYGLNWYCEYTWAKQIRKFYVNEFNFLWFNSFHYHSTFYKIRNAGMYIFQKAVFTLVLVACYTDWVLVAQVSFLLLMYYPVWRERDLRWSTGYTVNGGRHPYRFSVRRTIKRIISVRHFILVAAPIQFQLVFDAFLLGIPHSVYFVYLYENPITFYEPFLVVFVSYCLEFLRWRLFLHILVRIIVSMYFVVRWGWIWDYIWAQFKVDPMPTVIFYRGFFWRRFKYRMFYPRYNRYMRFHIRKVRPVLLRAAVHLTFNPIYYLLGFYIVGTPFYLWLGLDEFVEFVFFMVSWAIIVEGHDALVIGHWLGRRYWRKYRRRWHRFLRDSWRSFRRGVMYARTYTHNHVGAYLAMLVEFRPKTILVFCGVQLYIMFVLPSQDTPWALLPVFAVIPYTHWVPLEPIVAKFLRYNPDQLQKHGWWASTFIRLWDFISPKVLWFFTKVSEWLHSLNPRVWVYFSLLLYVLVTSMFLFGLVFILTTL